MTTLITGVEGMGLEGMGIDILKAINEVTENNSVDYLNSVGVKEDFLSLDANVESEITLMESYDEEDDFVMDAEEFGYFLVNMRENLEVNQGEMADLLGINRNSYNAYENGKRIPKGWEAIQNKVNILVKNYKKENRGQLQKLYLDKETTENLIDLHNKGLNNVQISIQLDLDENKVVEYLSELGFEPKVFSLSW